MRRLHYAFAHGLSPKKPLLILIAPGFSLVLVGCLMMVALTGFRFSPAKPDGTVTVAGTGADGGATLMPLLTVSPRPEFGERVVAAAGSLPEVATITEIRNGTVWLNAWAAAGSPEVTPRPGYRVPLDVAAIHPGQYQVLVPEELKSKFLDLDNGGALLSRTGAALRGITELGSLQFGGTSIPVIGVVDDELVRNHEVLVSHTTGQTIGVHKASYLAIGLNNLASGKLVEDTMRSAIPAGISMKVRGPEGSGASSLPSPLLRIGEVKAIFGEFSAIAGSGSNITIDQAWIDANTVEEHVPYLGTFRCHKRMFPQMRAAFEEIEQAGLGGLIRPGDFGGCFSPRFIRAGNDAGLSKHAWAIAFDFNVMGNLYGQVPTMDMRIVEIMERRGFSWGGHWSYPDGMHFEYIHDAP